MPPLKPLRLFHHHQRATNTVHKALIGSLLNFQWSHSSAGKDSKKKKPAGKPPSLKKLPYSELRTYSPAPNERLDDKQKTDHRSIGSFLSLFTAHPSSPGSPLFQPDGTHIFHKLQEFLRAQYPRFGIQEVITPTIYKESIWVQSGHSDHYKDDMFTVTGRGAQGSTDKKLEIGEDEKYGLKPMNCPGHCLLFQSQKRSYRDLPIRYADFSPLHRNELSGSLSGLTRLRRFHQDDVHIFCRPMQVGKEILTTLRFVKMVYKHLDVGTLKLVLSARPNTGFIGTEEEWERAEAQLKTALEKNGQPYQINKGDGAFYGPKIDIILTDSKNKQHQTATIQLDFQLPQRFGLEYQSPAPEQEAKGLITVDPALLAKVGTVTPIIIHRAVLGSLERFMALLLERYQGHWPFWLSPRQMIVLTVGDDPVVQKQALKISRQLSSPGYTSGQIQPLGMPNFIVDIDLSDRSIAKKLVDAKLKRYNIICTFGKRDLQDMKLTLNFSGQSDLVQTWNVIEKIKPGSQGPIQKVAANTYRNLPGVQLTRDECTALMIELTSNYL